MTKAEDVIEVEPVDVVSARDDALMALLLERHAALTRAIDSVAAPRPDLDIQPGLVRDLEIHRATILTVVYRASVGSQHFATPPQSIDAMFFADEFRVVNTSTATYIPVAREISRAIAPLLDPAELAPLIVTVLDATSLEDAMHRLDDYGVASVIDVDRETVSSTVAVDVIDEQGECDHVFDDNVHDTFEPHRVHAQPGINSTVITASDDNDVEEENGHYEVIEDKTHQHSPSVRQNSDNRGEDSSPKSQGTVPSRGDISGTTSVGKQPRNGSGSATRMRSYVLYGDDSTYGTVGDESPRALQIDRAGVDRVLTHERAHGREPEEQDHTHPGFDVLSRGKDGSGARRIEIKSIQGEWTIRGVMLSARQFREADEHGDQFWLYIVENAEDDDLYRIHRIQNPARRIDFFGFDNGWKAVCEPDIELDAHGLLPVRSTRALLGLSPGGGTARPDDD